MVSNEKCASNNNVIGSNVFIKLRNNCYVVVVRQNDKKVREAHGQSTSVYIMF